MAASLKDVAAMNMYSIIKSEYGEEFEVRGRRIILRKVEGEVLYIKEPSDIGAEEADAIIVLSRHSGTPGGPIITTHVPGNFGPASYGGKDKKVSIAMPFFMKNFLRAIESRAKEIGYPIALEPTHHGPSLDIPIAFVEVGSTEENWKDLRACKLVAFSTIEALRIRQEKKYTPAIAIGGPHLNSKFSKLELTSKYAIGHFIRKLDTKYLDLEMLKEAINRNTIKAQVAIIDWKGIKGERRREIVRSLECLNVQIIKAKNALRGEKLE